MANINTSTSITRAGAALLAACEKTKEQLAERMKQAGCGGGKTVKVTIPRLPEGEETVFCGLNGVRFYFERGTQVTMPEAVAEILRNCGILPRA